MPTLKWKLLFPHTLDAGNVFVTVLLQVLSLRGLVKTCFLSSIVFPFFIDSESWGCVLVLATLFLYWDHSRDSGSAWPINSCWDSSTYCGCCCWTHFPSLCIKKKNPRRVVIHLKEECLVTELIVSGVTISGEPAGVTAHCALHPSYYFRCHPPFISNEELEKGLLASGSFLLVLNLWACSVWH